MATYDYRCTNCGNDFTVRATFKEKEAGLDPECPLCHERQARQVIRTPMMIGQTPGGQGLSMPVQSGSCCGSGGSCGCE